MNSAPEIVNDVRLFVDGYVYSRSKFSGCRVYWDFLKLRNKECTTRASTVTSPDGLLTVVQGPDISWHQHAPNREEADAERKRLLLKRAAQSTDDRPAAMVREELAELPAAVLSHLPERENLKQSIRRVRKAKKIPSPCRIRGNITALPNNCDRRPICFI